MDQSRVKNLRVLGLGEKANADEVKKAYKVLARKFHPDKNGGSKESVIKFQEINEAYVLLNCDFESEQDVGLPGFSLFVSKIDTKSGCLVVELNENKFEEWYELCKWMYGQDEDQGDNGYHFRCTFLLDEPVENAVSNDNDPAASTSNNPVDVTYVCSIHLTLYKSTKKILVQGNSFGLWYLEHFPYMMDYLTEGRPIPDSIPGLRQRVDNEVSIPEARKSCTKCDMKDNDKMIECSFRKEWMHYDCTNLSASDLKPYITKKRKKFKCNTCQQKGQVKSSSKKEDDEMSSNTNVCVTQVVEKLVGCIQLLEKRIDNLEQQVVSTIMNVSSDQNSKAIDSLATSITNIQSSVDSIHSRMSPPPNDEAMKDSIERLSAEKRTMNVLLETKNEDNRKLRDENITLRKSVQEYKDKIKDLENKMVSCENNKTEITKYCDTLDSKLSESTAENNHLKTVVNDLEDSLKEVWDNRPSDYTLVEKKGRKDRNDQNQISSQAVHESKSNLVVKKKNKVENQAHQTNNQKLPRKVPEDGAEPKGVHDKEDNGHQHLVLTSSLGKGLDTKKIQVSRESRVIVKSISGARIEDMSKFLRECEQGYTSVTILAGTNNISRGERKEGILQKYQDLVSVMIENHPDTPLHICELPSRIDCDEKNDAVIEVNNALIDFCDQNNVYLVNTGTTADARLLSKRDGLHLSPHGTALLASKIKATLRWYNSDVTDGYSEKTNDNYQKQTSRKEPKRHYKQGDADKKIVMEAFARILGRM